MAQLTGEYSERDQKVPKTEIERRVSLLRSYLMEKQLDGAFLLQNVDIFYFSGTIQSSVLFIPCKGDPILMVQKSLQRAKEESPLDRIVPLGAKGEIAALLQKAGISPPANAGLEMDVVPASIYFEYAGMFPNCRFADISGGIRLLRMIKTPYEVDQIRKAARILDKGFSEVRTIIREGMTELEVDGHLSLIARREGHMGVLRMRGWNQEMTYAHVLSGESGSVTSFLNSAHGGSGNTPAAQGAGFRKIGRNEPIGIDYGVGVNGYVGDEFRTLVIGDLSEELKEAHHCAVEILQALAHAAKPGILCSYLYHLAESMAEKAGFRPFFEGHGEGQVNFLGHGIGLEIDELPVISPWSKASLQEGMVIAIEPKFVFPGKGLVGIEDDYLVTSSGLERLTLTDQVLLRI
ncbi:MAG: aminopeptidase P family protein [Deltaproteobacteria bacterium HGW-Deltaproteobacteria-15]|nr:MAG: aminopeptidase P family protein [Deltaproteobacteria bacterium HGW-Deltaproteobacteria-15]